MSHHAKDAIGISTRAVEYDKAGQLKAAVYFYKQSVRLLDLALGEEPNHPDAQSWVKRMHEYENRAQFLQYQGKANKTLILKTFLYHLIYIRFCLQLIQN